MNPVFEHTRREVVCVSGTAGAMLLSGCLNGLRQPPVGAVELAIRDIRFPSVGLTTVSLPIVLSFHNTGSREVPSPTAAFDVFINQEKGASADVSTPTIQPDEQTLARTNALIDVANVSKGVVESIRDNNFTVRLEGELTSGDATAPINLEAPVSV